MSETMLECQHVSKTFIDGDLKVDVLRDVDLKVEKGERIAIIGASGSGKTTLLQLLGGLDRASAGTILVAGKDMMALNEKRRGHFRNQHLGFIYQFHHLLPEFNALENVAMPLLIRGLSHKVSQEKAAHLIEQVGLKERLTHRVGELSGGERQRIAIARALVTDPSCVLADEPTGNLDQATADHVFDIMLQLNQSMQTSFIMVTHNQVLASKHDRVLRLVKGGLEPVPSLRETK